jgi:hypothetical protein
MLVIADSDGLPPTSRRLFRTHVSGGQAATKGGRAETARMEAAGPLERRAMRLLAQLRLRPLRPAQPH